MMIPEKIAKVLNQQIGHEFEAMIQYLAIANYIQRQTLPELARHFYAQANEERTHAMKFIQYLHDTGAELVIPAIREQQCSFESVEDAVNKSLQQEIIVTNQINAMVKLCREENDYTTENFLGFFINEQVEEVSSMQDLLTVVKRAGNDRLLLVEEFVLRQKNSKGIGIETV